MRKIFAALLVASLVLPSADALPIRHAKEPEIPPPDVPKPAVAKPAGPTFLERLFSTGPAPTPAPIRATTPAPIRTATPAPKRRPRRHAPPVDDVAETPKASAPKTAKVTVPPTPKVNPPTAAKVNPPATTGDELPPPPKGKGAKPKVAGKKPAPAVKIDVTGMDDAAKFKAVKAQAMQDPEVKDLKSKADGEVDDAAAQKALVAYNRALFRKIREIEPSVAAYSERVETSMTKRLSAEKSKP